MLRFIEICTNQIEMHKMLKTIRRNTCAWLQPTGIQNIDGKSTNEIRCIDVKRFDEFEFEFDQCLEIWNYVCFVWKLNSA